MSAVRWSPGFLLDGTFQVGRLPKVQTERTKATCQVILSSHHHPHRICDNMSLRQSFSRFRNKAKEKLSPIFNRTKRREVNVGGGGFNNSALSLRSEPGIVVGGEFEGGEVKIGTGGDDPRPENPLPMSRSAVEIGHDQGGSDDKVSGGEISQEYLHSHPHVQTGSGSGREREDTDGKRVDGADTLGTLQSGIGNAVTPIPSISRGGGTEGM